MKADLSLLIPDNAQVRIELVMTVSEARELRDRVGAEYPGWKFAGMLSKAIDAANKHFEATQQVEP